MAVATIPRARLNDSVYEAIREDILSQKYSPGQRLDLDELAQHLGVSMTPLKDALNRLASDGLIEIIPRRGTYVTSLKQAEIAEAFDVRRALETLAVQLMLERTSDQEVHEIADTVEELDRLASSPDWRSIYQEYVIIDSGLHHRIVELSGNQRLLAAYEREHTHMFMARARYGTFEQGLETAQQEHRALRDALLRRDVLRAQTILSEHIQRAKSSLLSDFDREHHEFPPSG